uniref:Uncharacterized protein n=1 Tax=Arundo donax TaxID=35708 RepID=A0A0A9CXS7_ARUDO
MLLQKASELDLIPKSTTPSSSLLIHLEKLSCFFKPPDSIFNISNDDCFKRGCLTLTSEYLFPCPSDDDMPAKLRASTSFWLRWLVYRASDVNVSRRELSSRLLASMLANEEWSIGSVNPDGQSVKDSLNGTESNRVLEISPSPMLASSNILAMSWWESER